MTNTKKPDIMELADPAQRVAPIEKETEMPGAAEKSTALDSRLSGGDMKEGRIGEKADGSKRE